MTSNECWHELLPILARLDCVTDFQKCRKNECLLHGLASGECIRDWYMKYHQREDIMLWKSAAEIANMFGVGERIVQRWCEHNHVPFIGSDHRKIWTFYPNDIERFKNRRGRGRPFKNES